MTEQQLKTVQYLYEINITYRDITPTNILVKSRYLNLNIKLSDFGLSSNRPQLKTFYNTEDYLTPEIYKKNIRYINIINI